MLAEFLKLIVASVVLNLIEGRFPVAPLFVSALTFLAVLVCCSALMFVLGRRDIRRFPYALKIQLAYLLALGTAVLFDMVFALPCQITQAIGLSARNWGIPAIIELVLFAVLWLSFLFPVLIVDGRQAGLARIRFFAGMIAVPLTLICFVELISEAVMLLPLGLIIAFSSIPFSFYLLLMLMSASVVVMFPLLLTKIWRTRVLSEPVLLQILMGMAKKARTGIRAILVWNTQGMRYHNALVTGFVMPFRYVLITDAMLEDFPKPYITAVFAHELTHARKRHFPILLLTGLALLCTAALVELVVSSAGLDAVSSALCGLLSAVPFVILVLGPLYRQLERQADLEGALLLENPGMMASALNFLGNFVPAAKRKHSFTHFGLDQRVGILLECSADPAYHETVIKKVRRSILLLLLPVVMIIATAGVSLAMRADSLVSEQWLLTSEICVERDSVEQSAYCLEHSLQYKRDPQVLLYLALHYLDLGRVEDAQEILSCSTPDADGMYFLLRNGIKQLRVQAENN